MIRIGDMERALPTMKQSAVGHLKVRALSEWKSVVRTVFQLYLDFVRPPPK